MERGMLADAFALLCVCVEGTDEPEGSGQQSQAAHAETSSRGFKQAPACNMDETQAPCRTVEDLGAFSAFNCLFPCVCDRFYPVGYFTKWSSHYVELWLYISEQLAPLTSISIPLTFPPSFSIDIYCSIPRYSTAASCAEEEVNKPQINMWLHTRASKDWF